MPSVGRLCFDGIGIVLVASARGLLPGHHAPHAAVALGDPDVGDAVGDPPVAGGIGGQSRRQARGQK